MAMNSLLSGLVGEVYLLTKRPDLEAATKQAVKNATLKLHQSDYFYKDLFESSIQFPTAKYFQQFDYKVLFPQWRSLKYIRKVSFDTALNDYVGSKPLTVVLPETIFDDYQVERTDVCYAAGASINIKTSTEEKYFLVGCYLYPNLVDETFESWIASELPYAIIYDAAATIFKGIGFDEMAAQYRNDSAMWMRTLMTSNIVVTGE